MLSRCRRLFLAAAPMALARKHMAPSRGPSRRGGLGGALLVLCLALGGVPAASALPTAAKVCARADACPSPACRVARSVDWWGGHRPTVARVGACRARAR